MLRRFHWLPLLLIGLGFAAALGALALRYRVEARTRAVSLVLDYTQFRALAASAGVPLDVAYEQFRSAGVTGLALTEETLADLQSDGSLEVKISPTSGGRAYLVRFGDPMVGARVVEYLQHYLPPAPAPGPRGAPLSGDRVILAAPDGSLVSFPGRFDDLRATPTGLDPSLIAEIRTAGMDPVVRIANPLGLTRDSLRWSLGRLQAQGVTTVVFSGEEVIGYRELVEEAAAAFRELGLLYGSIEMGKQRGDDELARRLMDRTIRTHSISPAEMTRLTTREAIERYVRGAVERNIRLQYVRLPVAVSENTFSDSVAYVAELTRQLGNAGFGVKVARPLIPVWPGEAAHRLVVALIGIGVGAGAVVLLAGIVPLALGRQALLTAAAGILVGLAGASGISLGLQGAALLAAIVFPTLGFVLFPQPIGAFADHEHALVRDRSEAVVPALAEFAAISVVTLIGAVMVAGLLSDIPFMLKVKSFAGIKAATVVPLLLVGLVYLTGATGEYPSLQAEREAVAQRVREFLNEPLRVWHTVAVGVGLVALALLVLRSGNDPGIGVSDTELRFRALLDRTMGVRPRTKEFLMGHPALLLGLAMAVSRRWRDWALPVILVGVIGQVGMLNSFCHLHTPVRVTVLRTFNGLWTGGLIGILLILVWLWLQKPRWAPKGKL
jgi:hypothetical protein